MNINALIKYIVAFFVLILIQTLLLNNVNFTPLSINPYIYVLFILILPFETPKWMLLLLAFFLGLFVDIFGDTMGMHAAACVLMAFVRPSLLLSIAPRDGYEKIHEPTIFFLGFSWFVKYALILIFVHHFFLLMLDSFRLTHFFFTFLKIIISTIVSTTFIVLSQYFVLRK